MHSRLRLIVSLVAMAVVLAGCGSTEGLVGAELYANSCAACHGSAGSGGSGPALDAGSDAEAWSDAELVAVITNGVNRMPGYADRMSSDQIQTLVEYLRELQAAP